MLRVVGIAALLVLTACSQNNANAGPSPSPVIPLGNWNQNLTFTGEVTGLMTAIVADTADQQSECTGSRTRNGETWSDSFYGVIDSSGQEWEVVFLIQNFRGPGTYAGQNINIQVVTPDLSRAWLSLSGDKVNFTMDTSQQSGTIDADLTDAASGQSAAVHLAGSWNCKG